LPDHRDGRGVRAVAFGVVQQPGDAEIQQPHAAVSVDQDVARLDVPVHDQGPVRVRDRRADVQEQAQPGIDGQPAAVAGRGQRLAVDMLHGEPGHPGRGEAAGGQPGDARVLESGQDPALAREPLLLDRIEHAVAEHLDRRLLGEPGVLALAKEDAGAAALADQPHDAPGAELAAGPVGAVFGRVGPGLDQHPRQRVGAPVQRAGGIGGVDQAGQNGAQPGFEVPGGQPGGALPGRQRQGLVQQRRQHRPVADQQLGIGRAAGHGRLRPWPGAGRRVPWPSRGRPCAASGR